MRKETQALKLVLAVCVLAAVGCAFGVGAGANPYGVCAHVSRDEFGARVETYDMMALAGLGYVRSDFDWFQCAKGGAWDFAMFDKMASAWSSTTCGASGSSPSRSALRPGASTRANPPFISQGQESSCESDKSICKRNERKPNYGKQ